MTAQNEASTIEALRRELWIQACVAAVRNERIGSDYRIAANYASLVANGCVDEFDRRFAEGSERRTS